MARATRASANVATDPVGHFDRVETRGVGKVYGRERALLGVDVTLPAGDAVAIVGRNGAGKSTLLGILSTLVRPSTGEVRFGGQVAGPAHRGRIGLLAHESLCYGDLSGRENLDFFARLYRVEEARSRVEELLAQVGIAAAADRPARTYSRGMLQRLAVARAILHRPQLLLLDEPFTGLDREGVAMLVDLLSQERARGAILAVVSHDLEVLPALTRRALILRRGRLVHDGPAPDTGNGFRALYREHAGGEAGAEAGVDRGTPSESEPGGQAGGGLGGAP